MENVSEVNLMYTSAVEALIVRKAGSLSTVIQERHRTARD